MDDAVIIALGSNLPGEYASPRALLEAAVKRFDVAGLRVLSRSRWWRSAAWPDPTKPDYLNGVALVETSLSPREVMAALLMLEGDFGRRRGELNAPRTLDLDLIAHGRAVVDEPGLILPHPQARERRFVMGPLAELAPGWRHPVDGATALALAASSPLGKDAAPT
jgi:2-amino-4-hydroxy-6-hydroxymethyldihydropteridine diphosphokinase